MSEGHQPRCAERVTIDAELPVRRSFAPRWMARVSDVSTHGCRIDLVEQLRADERLFVYFPGIETVESTARWTDGYTAGVQFAQPLHPAVFAMVGDRLRAADSSNP